MEIKVRLPEDLAEILKKHEEIDFSRVACDAIKKRALEAELAEEIARKSTLSEEDAEEIGRQVKTKLREKYR